MESTLSAPAVQESKYCPEEVGVRKRPLRRAGCTGIKNGFQGNPKTRVVVGCGGQI